MKDEVLKKMEGNILNCNQNDINLIYEYIEKLEHALNEIEEYLKGAYEMACYTKSACIMQDGIDEMLEIIQEAKGNDKNGIMD